MSVDTPSTWTIKDGLGVSQSAQRTQDGSGNTTPQVALRTNGAPVEAGNPLPAQDAVAGAALGTPADAAWSGSGSGSVVSLLKAIAGNGGGAVESVVGATGVVTATQIATAIAGTGLTVSGNMLNVNFPTPPVTSVAGQTGAVTSTELATALAGSGLAVSGGQLTITGGGSSTIPVTNPGTVASYALAFPSSGSVCYDIHVTQALTLTISGGTAGQYQELNLVIRQPSGGGISVTLPTGVLWAGLVAPSVGTSPNQVTFIKFATSDGGTTYLGGI